MKLYYLFLLVMLFLMSCERTENVSEARVIGSSAVGVVLERTVDGHDYISIIGREYVHSGTCKKCKQERDSVNNLIFQKLDSIKNENN